MAENEAAQVEQIAPEPAPEPKEQETEKVERVVPLAELQRERERRKEVEARTSKLEDRLTQLYQAAHQPRQVEEPKVPSVDENPIEHFKANQERLDRENRRIMQELAKRQQAEQHQANEHQFVERYTAAAAEYAEKQPDFMEAYTFLEKARDDELKLLGWTDPAQRRQRLQIEEKAIAFQAFQDGVSPAERLYNFAKFRGYKPGSTEDAEKLDTIAAGQKSAKSLSGVGGNTPAGRVSLSQLAEMTDDEFAKATKGDNWRKLMGG